jgi:two-component system sensor histidine kinase YesM
MEVYMIKKSKEIYYNTSLASKIRLFYFAIIIPILILVIVWGSYLSEYNRKYDRLIRNAATASAFSIDFKQQFDDKIYLIIIGSQTYEEADPIRDINEAKAIIDKIKSSNDTKKIQPRITYLEKFLDNLKRYSEQIHKNVEKGNMYDVNMTMWENDVQVVTSLIQDTVLEFLYYETREIDSYRNEMEKASVKMFKWSVLLIGILFLITFLLSIIIPKSITKPIRYLCKITEQVSHGDLTVRSSIRNGVEVSILSDSLNRMIQRISDLFETVKTEQKQLREAELELLQMQINPHFLYNTLDTIVWLAESGKQKEVVDMVVSLSNFFRSSLNQGKDIITIGDEVFHATNYLKIQQVRYQDIMDYEILIPIEINSYLIPKITLQPLIENALYHGIKNKRCKGKITVTGKRKDNYCVLSVTDNGIGIQEDRLNEVKQRITKNINNKKDNFRDFYALYNVNERIQLKFGEEYGIRIHSNYGEGTQVDVYLPCVRNVN